MIGMCLVHLLGRIFCGPSDEDGSVSLRLVARLKSSMDVLRSYGFDVKGSLLELILKDLDGGLRAGSKASTGWERLKRLVIFYLIHDLWNGLLQ